MNSYGVALRQWQKGSAPEPAERVVLKKFHSARYLHVLKEASEGKFHAEAFGMGIGTPDCPVFEGLYEGAVLAAGGTLVGAKLILSGEADVAFNPSGGFHHARPERASGFCYINDVALACMILAEEGKRVLYLGRGRSSRRRGCIRILWPARCDDYIIAPEPKDVVSGNRIRG